MKKVTWLLSLAFIMMPMTLGAQEVYAWDFESEEQFNEWTIVDHDGDGFNWHYYNNKYQTADRIPHRGDGLVCSASFDNNTKAKLTPDNWMISPEVTLHSVLSLWACAQDYTWPNEVFGVFVCVGNSTNPDDFVQVGEYITTNYFMTEYTFDLSEYAGKTGRFAIRHHQDTDMFVLDLDDICLAETNIQFPTAPSNLSATPDATTANVTWDGTEGDSWTLRYRLNNPLPLQTYLWDLTTDNYESQLAGWTFEDRDGDGFNWMTISGSGYDPTNQTARANNISLISYSHDGGKGLTPDNWLISPELTLGGTFSFWASNDTYPDVLGVYVITKEGEFQLGEYFTPNISWTKYEFDTGKYYEQVGRIAICHHNCFDQYKLLVDYLSYVIGDQPAPWVEVSGITDTNYTIEGLKPNTEYMIEVQSCTGRGKTEWTEPVIITTDNISITTGMKSVESSNTDANTYSVTGVRVNNPSHLPKGIYIIGGKKVVVK